MTLILVYGSLKRGGRLHHALEGSDFIGPAVALGFAMYDLGAFPGIVPHPQRSSIRGELYSVDADTLADLDRIEGTPSLYRREETEVYFRATRSGRWDGVPSPAPSVQDGVQVYVYNGTPPEEDRIPTGEWPVGGGSDS